MLIPYAYILPVMTINLQERLFAVCPRINLASWQVMGILCGLILFLQSSGVTDPKPKPAIITP